MGRSRGLCSRSWAALGAFVGGPDPSWADKWPKPEPEGDLARGSRPKSGPNPSGKTVQGREWKTLPDAWGRAPGRPMHFFVRYGVGFYMRPDVRSLSLSLSLYLHIYIYIYSIYICIHIYTCRHPSPPATAPPPSKERRGRKACADRPAGAPNGLLRRYAVWTPLLRP